MLQTSGSEFKACSPSPSPDISSVDGSPVLSAHVLALYCFCAHCPVTNCARCSVTDVTARQVPLSHHKPALSRARAGMKIFYVDKSTYPVLVTPEVQWAKCCFYYWTQREIMHIALQSHFIRVCQTPSLVTLQAGKIQHQPGLPRSPIWQLFIIWLL